MKCIIDYTCLEKLLKAYEFDDDVAETVADYLTECIEYPLDIYHYIWNTLLFNVHIFDDKESMDEHIELEQLDRDDCFIFKSGVTGKYYLETY